ncbi:MAG: LytTR family DNA-binding domain-containing protein [Thermoanaerobaculia bacterium]
MRALHTLRTLIVDDEPLARRKLRRFLASERDVSIVGECADGEEAVKRILEGGVDLVLLDIAMPGLTGLEVIERVGPKGMPAVVFVTAYDEFAVKAFDDEAVDYVLKPFDRERLARAVQRVRRRTDDGTAEIAGRLAALLAHGRGRASYPDRLLVRSSGAGVFVEVADVDWIEAQANYVALHVGKETHLIRETLGAIEERLDPERFVRIRRTAIVNLARVKALKPWTKDEHVVVLKDGTRLAVGPSFRARLEGNG